MSKSKWYGLGVIMSLVVVLVSSYFIFEGEVEAATKAVIKEGETYTLSLQQAVTKDSLTNGTIVLKDSNGNEIQQVLVLDETGKTLTASGLKAGLYTITVKKGAYKKATKLPQDQEITLQIVGKIEKISSEKDLKAYFENYLAVERAGIERETFATEESKAEGTLNDSSAMGSGGGGEFSSTNNQVDGIEEGDITVTDGQYIYTLVDNRIIIVDAKDLKVVKRIIVKKDIYPTHLMLHEKTLIVAYSEYVQTQKEPYYDGKSVTKVAFYDVSDAKNTVLIREVGHDGDIVNVRKLGNYLYVVSSRIPSYWILPENPNVELRPSIYDENGEQLLPFDKIRLLPESPSPNYLIVSAIDVSKVKTAKWNTESFLGNSGQLYMSSKAIYITSMNNRWLPLVSGVVEETSLVDGTTERELPQQENETTIYKISIDKTSITLGAQGKVKGSVLNQFSMDEHNGYFRIATTEGSAWGAEANSKNHLFILDSKLKQVGAVKDLAKGERIYSARFMGDKAYIVTFKETDPLFVIDTKNPTAPKVLGELKIPGFSNYLHPIGENHLLGIGYDTEMRMDENSKEPFVVTNGMKLSLFDVTNFNKPVEQQAVVIGGQGTYSSVNHDHKALFRDPRNNLFGFPITIYEETDEEGRVKYEGTGAHIYQVTSSGIKLTAELMEPARPGELYEDSYNSVQRLLYIDNELFTVSRTKITSYDGKTFKKQETVGF
jgi:inhibitor of cysteine peptidase